MTQGEKPLSRTNKCFVLKASKQTNKKYEVIVMKQAGFKWDVFIMGVTKANSCEEIIGKRVRSYM